MSIQIRVVPDAVKYDYPEEHSSPLTYESAGGGGGSDDYEDSHNSTRETRSVAKKLWKLQDKIDSKFDKAYSKLVHKAKKEKVWIHKSLECIAFMLTIYLLRTEV